MATSCAAGTLLLSLVALAGAISAADLNSRLDRGLGGQAGAPVPNDLRAVTGDAECGNRGTSCLDCTTVLTCREFAGVWKKTGTQTCDGDTPWCRADGADASCTAGRSSECTAPQPADFPCANDGLYPHPTDCTKYYICVNSTSYISGCSDYGADAKYDAATETCRITKNCPTLTCPDPGTQGWQVWPTSSKIYISCLDQDDPLQAVFSQCEDGETYDGKTCVKPACSRAGRFKIDDQKYYECVDLGDGRLSSPSVYTCPQGTFDETKLPSGRCVAAQLTTQAKPPVTESAPTTEPTPPTPTSWYHPKH
ncbi:hypothetical protein ONE63_006941 [Megalurothrips usitatus]|uniref:Chitin-binding type-2 domain-containing protein n=1 Tax=Megalurothrips usitatus TaxID=439358 RepID=A0AAV7XSZ7_9NEOP|nr:hypothetical protein ONE63_006941 [Megalurothrips usitatus]